MLSRWILRMIAGGMALSLLLNLCGSQGAAQVAAVPSATTASLSITPNWTFDDPAQEGSGVGYAVSAAGDVNGDGFSDVVVGADRYTVSVYREGAVFGFFGTDNGLPSSPNWLVGGGFQGSEFGSAVSGVGDVNGDGYDDVLVGAHEYSKKDLNLSKIGVAFLYFGSENGLSMTPGWLKEGDQKEAEYGFSVSGAGDVNSDGFADVIVGARFYESSTIIENEGAAFVYYGSAEGLNSTADWVAFGGLPGAGFGSAVASAGDVNQDGYDDVIVGAPGWGIVSVFLGSATGLQSDADWIAYGSSDSSFGRSLASADVNGDGCSDVLIGAPAASNDWYQVGAAYLYLGSPQGLADQPAWQVLGGQLGEGFGYKVSSAGDINLDGFADVLVSAPYHTYDQAYEGVVYAFTGSPNGLFTSPRWWAYGDKAEAYFGKALSSAGDVNQDGLTDIVVGTPEYKLETKVFGRAFVYLGQIVKYSYVYLPLVIKAGTE